MGDLTQLKKLLIVVENATSITNDTPSQWSSLSREETILDSDLLPWQVTVQIGSLAVICIFAIISNFLIFFSLMGKEQLLVPSNRLVFSLTSSNFCLAILVFPFIIVSCVRREWMFGIFWCNFTAFATVLVSSASVLTIGVISVDRFYYQADESSCMVDWSANIAYTCFITATNFILPLCVMLICYYFIFQVVRKKSRKIHIGSMTSEIPTHRSNPPVDIRNSLPWWFSLARKPSWFLASDTTPSKGFTTICLVLGAFVLTSGPYLVTSIATTYSLQEAIPKWFHILALWLMFSSSAFYPIIYGLLNRSIRKELKSLVFQSKFQQGLPPTSHHTSTSICLMDYSPFRTTRANSGFWASRRSSVTSIEAAPISTCRKLSQDSGAIVSECESEVESKKFLLQHNRRRDSAPPCLQLISTIFGRNAIEQSNERIPLSYIPCQRENESQCNLAVHTKKSLTSCKRSETSSADDVATTAAFSSRKGITAVPEMAAGELQAFCSISLDEGIDKDQKNVG